MLECLGRRASATGYHRFHVIRQIRRKWVRKVDRLVRKTMAVDSPKAQISGGKAAVIS
jgi:ABC-type phosphonate transport system ATPase subunit